MAETFQQTLSRQAELESLFDHWTCPFSCECPRERLNLDRLAKMTLTEDEEELLADAIVVAQQVRQYELEAEKAEEEHDSKPCRACANFPENPSPWRTEVFGLDDSHTMQQRADEAEEGLVG